MTVLNYIQQVSIHAPVMGAIELSDEYRDRARVSIHAPVMGAIDKTNNDAP